MVSFSNREELQFRLVLEDVEGNDDCLYKTGGFVGQSLVSNMTLIVLPLYLYWTQELLRLNVLVTWDFRWGKNLKSNTSGYLKK